MTFCDTRLHWQMQSRFHRMPASITSYKGCLRGLDPIQALLLSRVIFCSKKEFMHPVSLTSFGSTLSVSKTVKFKHLSHTFLVGCSLCHLRERIRAESLASTLRGRRFS